MDKENTIFSFQRHSFPRSALERDYGRSAATLEADAERLEIALRRGAS